MALRTAASLLALAASLSAQNVWVVDQSSGPGATHADLPAAVAAASSGDTVLVRSGTYSSFTLDGKGLVVTAEAGAAARVAGVMIVRNLPLGGSVVLRGLNTGAGGAPDYGLLAQSCAGAVWIEECALVGSVGTKTDAARVEGCASVTFVRCTLVGGDGSSPGAAGDSGGDGVDARGSRVALFDCTVGGGDGEWGDDIGGWGGNGLSLWMTSTGFASGCSFVAGDGGGADDDYDFFTDQIQCGYCGPGGSGVALLAPGNDATLLDCTYVPGQGGISTSAKGCPNGAPGQNVLSYDSPVTDLAGTARGFRLDSPRREGESTTLTFDGEPGDFAVALVSGAHGWTAPVPGGVFLLDPFLVVLPIGPVTPSGTLQAALPLPALADPLKLVNTLLAQSLFVTAALELRFGPVSELTLLDATL